MRRFELGEYETSVFDRDAAALGPALAATGLVEAALTLDGRLRLTARSVVGVLEVAADAERAELRVRPKLPIRRLLWLLGHARDDRGWRDDPADLTAEDDFVPAIAVAFAAATSRALAPGVLQGYRVADETLPLLRGRLREADQLRGRPGRALPLEVRYDDYSIDIAENRILRAAIERLLRTPGVPASARRGLHRLAQALAEVTRLPPGAPLPPTTSNRLTARYGPALRLARLVLSGHGLEHHGGGIRASGFAFDLNAAFQDWLTAVLRQEITTEHGGEVVAERPLHLDAGGRIDMYPDVSWWRGRACLAVADAKYKKTAGSSPPNADVYQMLAYCTALGLREGHLVYATDHEPRREYDIAGGVRVVAHGLNLGAPLDELRQRIRALAAELSTPATARASVVPWDSSVPWALPLPGC
ncbi:McrC family protein [Dactylosporangium sp. CA-233914]|uniref:McrC family protein n=1 Tax=Dactylosporangium sp. CA-233914 TaxID=3239934 RepID=UPI003D928760